MTGFEFDVPSGFSRVSTKKARITKKDVETGAKELVLIRLPSGMNGSDLNGIKITLSQSKSPGTVIGAFNREKRGFQIQIADETLSSQLNVALPSSEDPKDFVLGTPVTKSIRIVESFESCSKVGSTKSKRRRAE